MLCTFVEMVVRARNSEDTLKDDHHDEKRSQYNIAGED